MYNLLLSIVAGLAVGFGVRLLGFSLWACLVPGVLAFIGTYVVLARRIATRVQAMVSLAQKELSVAPANARDQRQRVEKAIKILQGALVYDKWQFLIASEIHAQIGMIKYMMKDLDGAEAELAHVNSRNYMALAISGALAFQRKDYSKMEKSFEAAVKSGKKEAVVWAAYAWCLLQQKEKDRALKVLARAVSVNPSDERLKGSLQSLQNDKRLKMKPYEPLWWQFGLEQPPAQAMANRRVQFERR
jgi:tetratricopeptide (TPR) repeat protein